MVELEDLTLFRFYKVKPLWLQRCDTVFKDGRHCNGLLTMYRDAGTLKMICMHVDCRQQYYISRVCTHCNSVYPFDNTTCDKCEPLVIQAAQYYLTIEECDKSIKKINKHYKAGQMNQNDWENAVRLNKSERESCQRRLQELKENHPIIEKHLETQIIQQ